MIGQLTYDNLLAMIRLRKKLSVVETGSVSADSLKQRTGDVKERSAGSGGADAVNSEAWV